MLRRRPRPLAGRYVLLEEIGRGASGPVHRARDLRVRREVAVKVLTPGGDDLSLLSFVREQAVRIRHPHVLAPTGWAADDDLVLIVMDLVRGGSLLDLLRTQGRPAEAVARVLLDQVLQALRAVHAAGVVHGDVKPANLLLEPTAGRPHARLADFGVATVVDSPVRLVPSGPVGTPGYLAPEQERGAPPDPSQDVYAAGVLARRLLTRPGPVSTLLDAMTRPEPALRPTPYDALRRLRSLPPASPRGP